jgi:hypothetical protein
MGLHETKKLLHCKGSSHQTGRQPTEWKKMFASHTSDQGLISRIYREIKKLNTQRTDDPRKKWANELNRNFSKEEIQIADKYIYRI